MVGQGQGTLKYTESNSEILTGNDTTVAASVLGSALVYRVEERPTGDREISGGPQS